MRTILFSLTTLFAISITGCLDDAQQAEPDPLVLTAEPAAPSAPADETPAAPIRQLGDEDAAGRVQYNLDADTDTGIDDPMHCEKAKECAKGYYCRVVIHRCLPDPE